MIRIGLNARGLTDPNIRGINRHTLGLLKALRSLDQGLEFHLFSDRPLAVSHAESLPGCPVHLSGARPHLLWEQLTFPWQAARAGMSVLHSPLNIGTPALRFGGAARVLTLHDLYMLRDFERSPGLSKGWLSFKASWAAAQAAEAVITVSNYSRGEILRRFPGWEAKVHMVHNGVESRFSPGKADSEVLARHGLQEGSYAFYIGGFDERKNVGLIAEALSALAARGRPRPQLALAGPESSVPPALRRAIAAIGGARWLGSISDQDLPHIYRGALCALLPSKEEGFGLPLLEAMACGCPALSSNATSLPEVGGDAAAYFSPEEPGELAGLVEKAMTDPAWLLRLKRAGLERARLFTWDDAARKTAALYRALSPGAPR